MCIQRKGSRGLVLVGKLPHWLHEGGGVDKAFSDKGSSICCWWPCRRDIVYSYWLTVKLTRALDDCKDDGQVGCGRVVPQLGQFVGFLVTPEIDLAGYLLELQCLNMLHQALQLSSALISPVAISLVEVVLSGLWLRTLLSKE